MVTNKIKALATAKSRISELERSIAAGLKRELAELPGQYGFDSVAPFIRELKAAAGKRGRPANKSVQKKRRKRAKITNATRAGVRKLVGAGKTGSQIASALGISLPSVQNIKKALGLVRGYKPSRKAKAAPKPAKRAAVARPRKKRVSPKKPAEAVSAPKPITEAVQPVPSA